MSFPRYEHYKDSGVEWLGEVPAHWNLHRLKNICSVFPSNVDKKSYADEIPVKLCNYTDVYYNEVIIADMDFMLATASADQIEKFSLRRGDTIITKDSEAADDIAISSYVPENIEGIVCGYHLSMIRPLNLTEINGAFIKRAFDTHFTKAQCAVSANGLTRVGLGQHAINNIIIPAPPFFEQNGIVDFLDRETAKLDALITEQRTLIDLLKEKRQAVISHAVTKGLDPDVAMKDSGVEWLGEVPAHWEIKKISHVAELMTGYPFPSEKFEFNPDGGIKLVRGDNVTEGYLRWGEKGRYWPFDLEYERRYELVVNDIVVQMDGSKVGKNWALIGKEDLPALLVQRITRVRVVGHLLPEFIYAQISSQAFVKYIDQTKTDPAIPHITMKNIGDYWITSPPVSEQRTISIFIATENKKIDALTAEAETTIALLQERRSALISAAVTGKIDVRRAA